MRARAVLQNVQRNDDGFTLIEGLIALGIIGFIMAMITFLLSVGTTAWAKQNARLKMETQAMSVIQILTYGLRQSNPSTITITNLSGETNNSLIKYTTYGSSNPVSIYLQTTTLSNGTKKRQILFAEPLGNTTTPTYSPRVMADNVVQLYFTFPKITDTSRVLVNYAAETYPLKNKSAVMYQTQETIYARN
jgi:prepilin-type N-terminal cleavage/methylation domain-containing protein